MTVPSAAWLWQQGPKKSEHSHGKHEEKEEHDVDAGDEGQEEVEEEDRKEEDDETPGEAQEQISKNTEEPGQQSNEEGDNDEAAKDKQDERPIGETIRNEPPNEITSSENKWTSEDEGLKEGDNDTVNKKSQQVKSIDADADEGKEDGPSDKVDKGHEGEQRGSRVTEQDRERKVSDVLAGLFPATKALYPFSSLLAFAKSIGIVWKVWPSVVCSTSPAVSCCTCHLVEPLHVSATCHIFSTSIIYQYTIC